MKYDRFNFANSNLNKVGHAINNAYHYLKSLGFIVKNKKRVKRKIEDGKILNVVFVIQYISAWNKLEPIYSKMKMNDRFNPTIVCVPLNIQNNILVNNKNDTYEYFVNNGYEVINSINSDNSWFDIKKLEPDYLFHSRPYNHFMPKCYTSSEIVKYSLICNVLYGLNLTKNVEPVLLNRDYFKDCFCYYALDKNEKRFYEKRFFLGIKFKIQKCFDYGGIGIEQMLMARPKEKQSNFKKTIIWTPRWSTDKKIGGSNFFNYKDLILKLAEEYNECLFIIRPHPLMFSNFISTGELSKTDVEKFKNYCENKSNIILDETKEYYETFWQSDILISDGSAVVPEYFATGKPILFCQSNLSETNTAFYNDIISRCYEVYNEYDLVNCFKRVLFDNDEMENIRKEFIDNILNNYKDNSNKIINSLLNWK